MKLEQGEFKGIKFWYRPGYSDLKTFKEVIDGEAYQKKKMAISKGERWLDCGGNVGAFTLLACSKEAVVTVFEPDPYNCEMIERNLRINGYKAEIRQAALVHDDKKSVTLFIGNNNQTWRNSIVKRWNNLGIKVSAENFDDIAKDFDCCKMDIEGAEMPILETTKTKFRKLVYEWSFDVDPSISRLWDLIIKQKTDYRVEGRMDLLDPSRRRADVWQKSWFPMCTNVFCFSR